MKKLYRLTTIPVSLNILLKNQLRYLNQYFHVTAVSSPGKYLDELEQREGVQTIAVEFEREINIKKDIKSLLNLIKVLKAGKPDIVHSNTPKSSLIAMLAAKIVGAPCRIYTITGLRFETEHGLKRRILIWMEQVTCRCATHVVAESKGVKRMIEENNLSNKPSVIIGNGNINGIDDKFWNKEKVAEEIKNRLKEELNIEDGDFVFLFVGRLTGDKGVNELVKAFSQVNQENIKLILVGPKEETLDALQSDTVQIIDNNDSIKAVGFQSDVRSYMAISHALILPSYREGFPNVILQAGAMMLPCIVTDVNGTEEVIDSKNGIIINKRNVQDLKNAMLSMINDYKSFDKEYCRHKSLSLFSQESFYKELLSFYQKASN